MNVFLPVQVRKFLQCKLKPNRQQNFEVPIDQSKGRLLLCIVFRRLVKCVSRTLSTFLILHEYAYQHLYLILSTLTNFTDDMSMILSYMWIVLQPVLVAVSNVITFSNPKAPLYARLAHGKLWNEVSLH